MKTTTVVSRETRETTRNGKTITIEPGLACWKSRCHPAPPSLARLSECWASAKSSLVLAIALAFLPAMCGRAAAGLGDPAAPLDVAEWVKGQAVDLANVKGKKIVVVEFWATWCGPCRVSIPHLTDLQKKFGERGVVVVGVSDEDAAKVRPFVDQMGEKMDYTVAVDNARHTAQAYMGAYGINGIPHAFVVDREGRVAWHGHPMAGLDKVLDQMAVAPAADNPAASPRAEAQRKLREFTERAARGEEGGQLEQLAAQLATLDRQLGGIESGRTLDLADLRRSARFQGLMREYLSAVAAGQAAAELEKIERQAAPLAPKGFKFEDYRGQYSLQRAFQDYYRAATGNGDASAIPALAARLEAARSTDAEALTEMAWTLLTDEKLKTRNPALALKLAQAAVEVSGGKDAGALETCARALFDSGKPMEAVAAQRRALTLATDKDRKAEMEQALKLYQAKTGGGR
jgi:thiol-disulfide isomerase/thioredoxin